MDDTNIINMNDYRWLQSERDLIYSQVRSYLFLAHVMNSSSPNHNKEVTAYLESAKKTLSILDDTKQQKRLERHITANYKECA